MTVSRWERGVAVPRPETLVKIAARLGVPVLWLMTGDGPAQLQPTGTGG